MDNNLILLKWSIGLRLQTVSGREIKAELFISFRMFSPVYSVITSSSLEHKRML